jgi:glutamate dehydrogenase/leucine dehydrogenase
MAVVRAAGVINSMAEMKNSAEQAWRTDHNNKTLPHVTEKRRNPVFATGNAWIYPDRAGFRGGMAITQRFG